MNKKLKCKKNLNENKKIAKKAHSHSHSTSPPFLDFPIFKIGFNKFQYWHIGAPMSVIFWERSYLRNLFLFKDFKIDLDHFQAPFQGLDDFVWFIFGIFSSWFLIIEITYFCRSCWQHQLRQKSYRYIVCRKMYFGPDLYWWKWIWFSLAIFVFNVNLKTIPN